MSGAAATAAAVAVAVLGLALVVAVSVRLSRHSPAALSEEDGPRARRADGTGRPAGPDAEGMGVADGGQIVTGPPPGDGVPTDAPPPRPAPER
ncbi:MAG TPA: hypothetical protein VF743_06930 [Acidimicrobiales bacterium]